MNMFKTVPGTWLILLLYMPFIFFMSCLLHKATEALQGRIHICFVYQSIPRTQPTAWHILVLNKYMLNECVMLWETKTKNMFACLEL